MNTISPSNSPSDTPFNYSPYIHHSPTSQLLKGIRNIILLATTGSRDDLNCLNQKANNLLETFNFSSLNNPDLAERVKTILGKCKIAITSDKDLNKELTEIEKTLKLDGIRSPRKPSSHSPQLENFTSETFAQVE